MKFVLLFLLASVAFAELSENCQYVNSTRFLTNVSAVEDCFETYTIDQGILDAIIRNLEIIHDFYPYTDVAMNPPSEPAGYFNKVNFTSALEDLKSQFATSGRVVSKVYRPTMKLIRAFRDGHFRFSTGIAKGQYENLFAGVDAAFPFLLRIISNGNQRKVVIHSPSAIYLPSDVCDTITAMYEEGYFARTVDGKDAFEFFANFVGDYNAMKSPQGTLVESLRLATSFFVLSYPLDDLFQEHTITFSDPQATQVSFHIALRNLLAPPKPPTPPGFSGNGKVGENSDYFNNNIRFSSVDEIRESLKILKNFKKRPVKRAHTIITCDTYLNTGNVMNYISIPSFSEDFNTSLQELIECVALFDTNKYPITLILPHNGGGNPILALSTQFLLMPSTDFRRGVAMRKSEISKHLAVDNEYFGDYSRDRETCETFKKDDLESFWKTTETDDFGDGVTHQRTPKEFISVRDIMVESLLPYALTRFVRDPTFIVVATDGYCFSACALLVYNIIKTGGAIVAGYGVTHPDADLFGAGQCPSGVLGETDIPECFDELKNNSNYGLYFAATFLESYDVSPKMDELYPGDYSISPVDVHTGYYDSFSIDNSTELSILLEDTLDIVFNFQFECNPKNKRLVLVSENCHSADPNAVKSGYICGSNGEWDVASCKIASCREGYVVDFENDRCVPNPCDPRYHPSPSVHDSSTSSSVISRPLMTLVISVFIFLSFIH